MRLSLSLGLIPVLGIVEFVDVVVLLSAINNELQFSTSIGLVALYALGLLALATGLIVGVSKIFESSDVRLRWLKRNLLVSGSMLPLVVLFLSA